MYREKREKEEEIDRQIYKYRERLLHLHGGDNGYVEGEGEAGEHEEGRGRESKREIDRQIKRERDCFTYMVEMTGMQRGREMLEKRKKGEEERGRDTQIDSQICREKERNCFTYTVEMTGMWRGRERLEKRKKERGMPSPTIEWVDGIPKGQNQNPLNGQRDKN